MTTSPWFASMIAVGAAIVLAGCGGSDAPRPTTTAATDLTSQPVVPPPPGDSTPKAIDSGARVAAEGTDSASRTSGGQSTVGTAASGAPPYTLNSAPEGNKAPMDGAAPKK